MNVHIMAGGPRIYIPELEDLKENVTWIGVDRGVIYLMEQSILIEAAFGDFDSVTDEEWQEIEESSSIIKRFKPEKDETDMELAMQWAIDQGATNIKLFGATGGRMDHSIANLQLLLRETKRNEGVQIEIIDRQNKIKIVSAGTYQIEKEADFPYISFFPYSTNIVGLTLEGFKYPLIRKELPTSSTLCISNELIRETGTFSFTKGILMVIRSRD